MIIAAALPSGVCVVDEIRAFHHHFAANQTNGTAALGIVALEQHVIDRYIRTRTHRNSPAVGVCGITVFQLKILQDHIAVGDVEKPGPRGCMIAQRAVGVDRETVPAVNGDPGIPDAAVNDQVEPGDRNGQGALCRIQVNDIFPVGICSQGIAEGNSGWRAVRFKEGDRLGNGFTQRSLAVIRHRVFQRVHDQGRIDKRGHIGIDRCCFAQTVSHQRIGNILRLLCAVRIVPVTVLHHIERTILFCNGGFCGCLACLGKGQRVVRIQHHVAVTVKRAVCKQRFKFIGSDFCGGAIRAEDVICR